MAKMAKMECQLGVPVVGRAHLVPLAHAGCVVALAWMVVMLMRDDLAHLADVVLLVLVLQGLGAGSVGPGLTAMTAKMECPFLGAVVLLVPPVRRVPRGRDGRSLLKDRMAKMAT